MTGVRGATTRIHARTCTADLDDGRGRECARPVPEDSPVSLCTLHLVLAAKYVTESHADLLERALHAFADEPLPAVSRPIIKYGRASVVYYMRFGDRIKIGTTTDLPQRLGAVPHDELLAVEPGGNGTERSRHAQFRSAHAHREWFHVTPELLGHCSALRQKHGQPLDVWRSLAGLRHAS